MGEEYTPDEIALQQFKEEVEQITKEMGLAVEKFCQALQKERSHLDSYFKSMADQLVSGVVGRLTEALLISPVSIGHIMIEDEISRPLDDIERALRKIKSDGLRIGIIGHGLSYSFTGGKPGYAQELTLRAENIQKCGEFLARFFEITIEEVWKEVSAIPYSIEDIVNFVSRNGRWPAGDDISRDWVISSFPESIIFDEYPGEKVRLAELILPYKECNYDKEYDRNYEPKPEPNYARTRDRRDWRFTESRRSLGKKKGIKSAHRR